ncbi:acyl-CoA dehydrogenase [Iodidimonas nitroreducens]|uniref:Acyl-CoA dehydrogenase n=1 Tax=Iodidimonas nitroreducens TaxID=1236968 RepID=A0A5A7N3W0_9PROT|nr:acyl-CoA dehydrogenase [Iodidimonas nitroreducens]GAK32819.1 isobutyryl-CoA dehydrogenase, mitochondrial [alpha proteobacterium Q-1]GER02962.1 acyl-CoA dehydrogenase [Iodidimonas nitroreducens]
MDRIINRRDLAFQLYEMLDVEKLSHYPRFKDHDRATYEAVIDAAEKLAIDKFANHAHKSDEQEPQFDGDKVSLIPEVKEAMSAYLEGGFHLAHRDEDEGGMQLPLCISQAVAAIFTGANAATTAYPFLTIAAANLLTAHGDSWQKERFLKPMLEGRFFGTMCLSEPQAGSSLGDIRTKAVANADGSYQISGTKMWISGGDHDLSENIIHLVLAKIPGGPAGVKGISLFIVPKYRLDEQGQTLGSNDVALAGLNHKMGYRGTTNCLLNFGESGACQGFLVGKPHHGLGTMFHMMNEARIGVGLGATMMGYAGYLYSLDYARQRPQGRPVDAKDPEAPQVPIIAHADVRHMLLAQKSYVEGGLSLCLYCAHLLDHAQQSDDPKEKVDLLLLLDFLTPLAKAWPSEFCLEANKLGMQILGGYGYTRDYPLERLYRDNRLNPIHEGTNGIQSLDLLGRKVMADQGRAFHMVMERMGEAIGAAAKYPALEEFVAAMQGAVDLMSRVTMKLVGAAREGKTESFLANSHDYLLMTGHIVMAWMWLRQATSAAAAIEQASGDERAFYAGKLMTARYFFHHELPKTGPQAAFLASLDTTVLDMPDAGF